jgi:CRP/FNR family transcriptional regulator, anaerobic regulatory protein
MRLGLTVVIGNPRGVTDDNGSSAAGVPLSGRARLLLLHRRLSASAAENNMADSARFALHRQELTASLEAGDRKIARAFEGSARRYRANELLIEGDCDHPFVYRMVEGWACRTRSLLDGRDQCILIFMPTDLFAVKSMFVERHPDDVRTLSESLIERLHYRDLHALYRKDPDVANRCTWTVIEEERRLHNWVVGLGQGSADERTAMLLLDFHARLRGAGVIPEQALKLQMPLTQQQLADYLGLTAIHVNRVLKALREREIVAIRDGEVRIRDFERLRQLALPLLDLHERKLAAAPGKQQLKPTNIN